MTVRVEAAGRSHVGLVRQRNEDAMYLGRSLVAVADGLGGHVAGDVASATVIDVLQVHDRPVEPVDLSAALGRAISAANEALGRKIADQCELAGMGTTLVAVLWSGPVAILANVGDSRAYLLRGRGAGGETSQITEDHTYRHLVADAADVPDLPNKLARFLDGRLDGRSPDLSPRDLRVGDRLLLCTDGLTVAVPDELIHAILNSATGANEVADQLVDLANERGGPDNTTVVVIDVLAA